MAQTWSDLDDWERRTLLKTLGPAGMGILAGCLGDGDGDGDTDGDSGPDADVPGVGDDGDSDMDGDSDSDSDGDSDTTPVEDLVDPRDYVIEGQTLRIPSPLSGGDPSTAFFIHRNVGAGVYDVPGDTAYTAMGAANGNPANGPGFHGAFNLEWHDPISHFYEGTAETIWTPEKVVTTISDDATWSDGEPVRAFDALPGMIGNGCIGPTLPSGGFYDAARYDVNFPDGPDGKVMEQIAIPAWLGDGPKNMEPPGPKEQFNGWREMAPAIVQPQTLGNYARMGGVNLHTPTHIEPYDCQTETLFEAHSFKWELIQNNPRLWNDAERYNNFTENDPDGRQEFFRLWQEEAPDEWIESWGGQLCRGGAAKLCVGEGDSPAIQEMYEKSRDPEWMTSLGLYEITEIMGSEGYRLEPNENHQYYDEHTFDEVILEWVQEDHREKAGLMAERYDTSGIGLSPEEQAVLPDVYDLTTQPSGNGFVLSLNHAYWPGQSVRVRQGLKFATDEAALAENLNPETNDPIHTPGWDNWGAEEFIDESWAQENLTNYEQDLDRAESLFEQAGFERGPDGNWRDPEGEPIDDVIATDEEAPVVEETVASQWRDFGIQIETLVQDSATLSDRWEGADDPLSEGIGEFAVAANMYPSDDFGGFFTDALSEVGGSNTFTYRRRARNWFDQQGGHGTPQDKVDYTEAVIRQGFAPINYASPGAFNTPWEIPPAGQFDAARSEWVPFDHSGAHNAAERGLSEFTGDLMPTTDQVRDEDDEVGDDPWDHYEFFDPDALNVDTLWEAEAWSLNWFLPDLPLLRSSGESYLNGANWHWGANQPQIEGLATPQDVVNAHWDFRLGKSTLYYPSDNMVWGNPANIKLNAEVSRK